MVEDDELDIEEGDSEDSDTGKHVDNENHLGSGKDDVGEFGEHQFEVKDNDTGKHVDNEDHLGSGKGDEGEFGEHQFGVKDNDDVGVVGIENEHLNIIVKNEDDKRIEEDVERLVDDTENKRDSDSSEDEDNLGVSYPDTSIDFQYTSGGKFQLQRGASTSSSRATEDFVDLGDGEVLDLRSLGKDDETRKQRLTAKQRRQMRKKASVGMNDKNSVENQENVDLDPGIELTKRDGDAGKCKQPITQQTVVKRGKKSKLKKIKEKYGDQDEEDRELMMHFLGSAGAPKESKGRKKAKDNKGRKGSAQNKQGEQRMNKDSNKGGTVKTTSNTSKYVDKKIENGNKISPGDTGKPLENFAVDLTKGLIEDNEKVLEEGELSW